MLARVAVTFGYSERADAASNRHRLGRQYVKRRAHADADRVCELRRHTKHLFPARCVKVAAFTQRQGKVGCIAAYASVWHVTAGITGLRMCSCRI